ncbi:MAG TPA: hypothetical protein VFG71_12385 [Nitrospiraceae bacterium]|nr:hypothetical protein [Nitrospiraceae bacterium]
MDWLITTAARALAAGDPLGALNRVALREDAPALALRGIAMAQLGDLVRAKALVRRAARAFGPKEAAARARCVVAEAEIALVSRELGWPARALDAARATRPGERRARAVSRGPVPPFDRAPQRGRAYSCRPGSRALSVLLNGRPRAGCCGDRDATSADEGGAGGARSGPIAPRATPVSLR